MTMLLLFIVNGTLLFLWRPQRRKRMRIRSWTAWRRTSCCPRRRPLPRGSSTTSCSCSTRTAGRPTGAPGVNGAATSPADGLWAGHRSEQTASGQGTGQSRRPLGRAQVRADGLWAGHRSEQTASGQGTGQSRRPLGRAQVRPGGLWARHRSEQTASEQGTGQTGRPLGKAQVRAGRHEEARNPEL